jgi:hypothetical protein
MNLVDDKRAIEWTPYVITSDVSIEGEVANVHLQSASPNLKTYQVRNGTEEWKDIPAETQLPLSGDMNTFMFRTVNLAGVTGPEHTVVIANKTDAD